MKRDFSSSARKNILNGMKSVENEAYCDAVNLGTDYKGFNKALIQELGIQSSYQKVGAHLTNVRTKSAQTYNKMERIFTEIYSLDETVHDSLQAMTASLVAWSNYISDLSLIATPSNGKFSKEFIKAALAPALKEARSHNIDKPMTDEEYVKVHAGAAKSFVKIASKEGLGKEIKRTQNNENMITKVRDETVRNEQIMKAKVDGAASAIGLTTALYTFETTDYKNGRELTAGWLKLDSSAANMYGSVYNYYDASLSPLQASRLAKKAGGTAGFISVGGSFLNLGAVSLDSYGVITDPNASDSQIVAQGFREMSAGVGVYEAYKKVELGKKTLTRGAGKYVWSTPGKNAVKLQNVTTAASVLKVGLDAGGAAADRYGKVTADGDFDMSDMSEVGLSYGVRGLTSVANELTFGLTDAIGLSDKAEEITDDMLYFADTKGNDFVEAHEFSSGYRESAKGMIDYANNEDNNIVGRIAVSTVAGAGMIGAVVIDSVGDATFAVKDWIVDGWNNIFH